MPWNAIAPFQMELAGVAAHSAQSGESIFKLVRIAGSRFANSAALVFGVRLLIFSPRAEFLHTL